MSQQLSGKLRPVYVLQRPLKPKPGAFQSASSKNLNLNLSLGSKQSPNSFLSVTQTRPEPPTQQDNPSPLPVSQETVPKTAVDFHSISIENARLRQENQQLKLQLNKIRHYSRMPGVEHSKSADKYDKLINAEGQQLNDLRGTIKKEVGEMKEVKIKLQTLSRQCRMYEELIDKMEERIRRLTHDLGRKSIKIEQLTKEIGKMSQLKGEVDKLTQLSEDMEHRLGEQDLEWRKWKQGWLMEKNHYLQRIRQLEQA